MHIEGERQLISKHYRLFLPCLENCSTEVLQLTVLIRGLIGVCASWRWQPEGKSRFEDGHVAIQPFVTYLTLGLIPNSCSAEHCVPNCGYICLYVYMYSVYDLIRRV